MGSITESQEPRRFFATADKQEFDPENWTSQDPLPPRCPPTNVQVLIVGAGFAGLMAALECWRKGHDVVGIVERNQGPNYSGDLIIIQPSALEIMKHWPQMRRELEEDKVTVGTYYYRHNGELVDGPAQPNYNAPEYVAEREARLGGFPYVGAVQIRKKFYRMLLRQVARLGFRVDYGQRVESYFEDESAGFAGVRMTDASIRKAQVVVAADGFRSASELLIADDEYPPTQSSGMSVYRTAFPAKLAFADEAVRQRWGGKHTYEFWMGSSMHIGLYLSPELAAFGITPRDHQRSAAAGTPLAPVPVSSLRTSLVHRVIEESFSSAAGKVIVQSDMMQADFLAAAWGHQMNGAGVVTSSIHADIAWTLGKYLLDLLKPNSKKSIVDMEISNLVVREGLVAQKNRSVPQFIQVSISTANIDSGVAYLEWHNVTNDGVSLADQEPIVTAQIRYGTAGDYLFSWVPTLHLVQGRIEALSRLADDGIANRLSNNMAYLLFADRLVDYADRYRGMQSVVLHGLEAFADVRTKPDDEGGVWTVPPFFIDSVCHLAGFVLNVSGAIDTKNFCVTPGWGSLRMARSLVAGGRYRSYVKMIPIAEDPTVYLGDVYVLEGDAIIGVMQAMKFRRYPRVLLNRIFTPAEIKNPASGAMPCANGAGSLYN